LPLFEPSTSWAAASPAPMMTPAEIALVTSGSVTSAEL
jgi:hypothetical protein